MPCENMIVLAGIGNIKSGGDTRDQSKLNPRHSFLCVGARNAVKIQLDNFHIGINDTY